MNMQIENFTNISRLIDNTLDLIELTDSLSVTVVSDISVIRLMIGELFDKYNFSAHKININEFNCDIYALTIDEDYVISVEPIIKNNEFIICDSDIYYIDSDLPYTYCNYVEQYNKGKNNISYFSLDCLYTEGEKICFYVESNNEEPNYLLVLSEDC